MFSYKMQFQLLPRCCGLLLVAMTATAVADTIDDSASLALAPTAITSIFTDEMKAPATPASTLRDSTAAEPMQIVGLGTVLDATLLDDQRGGSDLGSPVPLSGILTTGVVGENRAVDVVTGSNAIRDGAFSNASGIPVVIQNTGANVLIQNSTIVNLQIR